MPELLEGTTGLVVGVANKRSIAWAIARKLDAAGQRLVLTPACGLAGHTPAAASRAFEVLGRAAAQVGEELGRPR